MTRSLTLALLAATLCAAPSLASAQDAPSDPRGTLRVSSLYSFGGGGDLQHGFGLDLRYELQPDARYDGYFGVLAQSQYELGDAWRTAVGVTGGWGLFGLELGVAHRTGTATYAGSTGLHIGQSFTFGPVSIGGRLTIPLMDHIPQNVATPALVQGIEGALVIRVGFGFRLHGPSRGHGCHAHTPQVRDPHQSSHHGH